MRSLCLSYLWNGHSTFYYLIFLNGIFPFPVSINLNNSPVPIHLFPFSCSHSTDPIHLFPFTWSHSTVPINPFPFNWSKSPAPIHLILFTCYHSPHSIYFRKNFHWNNLNILPYHICLIIIIDKDFDILSYRDIQ